MLILSLVFMLLVSLTGCIIIPRYKYFDDIEPAEVSSIYVYDLREVDSLYGNFVKTETPVYEIPSEKIADFLNDIAKIRFSDTIIIALAAIDPSFYYDEWTVRINYTDGSYELISSDGFGQTYDKNGEEISSHHFGCDQEEWWNLIDNYLPSELFEKQTQDQ